MLSPEDCALWIAKIDATMAAAEFSCGLCVAASHADLSELVRRRVFLCARGVVVSQRWFYTRYGGDSAAGATTHLGNHADGTVAMAVSSDQQRTRSNRSVLIYLNAGFEGGATTFMSGPPPDAVPTRSVVPEVGKALVLRQDAWHRGDEVLPSGAVKYLLRTDAFVPDA